MSRLATSSNRRASVANPLPTSPRFAGACREPLASALDRRPVRPEGLLKPGLLATAIEREQKRVDRSDKAFGVLTVKITGRRSEPLLQAAADALRVVTRAADSIGWLRRGLAIGVLMCDMHELSAGQSVALETRLRSELQVAL